MGSTKNQRLPISIAAATIFLCLITIHSSPANSSAADPSKAYEILQDYNFPVGLLPKGVTGYYLDDSTGKFAAYFNGSCSFSLEGSYQLKYKPTIKGNISKGKLSSLEGVSVKLWFMWVDIVEVRRSGDNLDFSVGIASAGFPIDNFEECPQCGCGLNCNSRQVNKLRRSNPFVSSH